MYGESHLTGHIRYVDVERSGGLHSRRLQTWSSVMEFTENRRP